MNEPSGEHTLQMRENLREENGLPPEEFGELLELQELQLSLVFLKTLEAMQKEVSLWGNFEVSEAELKQRQEAIDFAVETCTDYLVDREKLGALAIWVKEQIGNCQFREAEKRLARLHDKIDDHFRQVTSVA